MGLGFLLGGFLFYQDQSRQVHEKKIEELKFITGLKVNQITDWRGERLMDARVNSSRLSMIVAGADDEILAELRSMTVVEGYRSALVADETGVVLTASDSSEKTLEPETLHALTKALAAGEPVFGDFFVQPETGLVFLDVVSPLAASHQESTAFLILRVDPQAYLYPLIQSWPTPSGSAETLIVRRDGDQVLFLNRLRHLDNPPLSLRLPLDRVEVPAVQAVLGKRGPFEGIDYRGTEVLAHLMPIPGSEWFMVAKVDRGEILAEINSLAAQTLVVVALSILLTTILGVYFYNLRQRLLYQRLLEAEQERSASRMETRTILYSIGDGVIAADRAGLVTHLNPVAEEMTGWKEEEALGRPLEHILHLKDEQTRARIGTPPVRQALEEGKISGAGNQTLLIRRDGRDQPVAVSTSPFRDQRGEVIGAVMVLRDQTEERLLEKERAIFNDTLSASLNEIYLFESHKLRFLTANAGALKNLGLSIDELRRQTPLKIKPEFTPHSFKRLLKPLMDGDKVIEVYETTHRRCDGSLYPVECHLQLIDRQGEKRFLEVVLDITSRRQAQKELLLSEERHRLLADNVHDVIWTADFDLRLTYVSPSVESLLGFTPQELTGRHLTDATTSASAAAIRETLKEGLREGDLGGSFKNSRVELEQRRRDGTTLWTEVSLSGMYNDQGDLVGIVGVTRDISERRRAQEELTFRLQFEELISRVSTRFINLPAEQIDVEILQALGEIGALIKVDRALAFSFDREKMEFCISHEWCRPGWTHTPEESADIFFPAHPALSQALLRNESVILESPQEIAGFLGWAGDGPASGLQSVAVFPIWLNQTLYGCLGFESSRRAHGWGEDNLLHLQQFSNILSSCFERNRLVREIERQAVRDELTGIYNRRGLMEIGQLELQRARRYHHSLGLIFFDVDHFKNINDTLGHTAGDLVLKEIARRAGEIIREVDVFCRWGGDEFLVLLPESDLEFTCQIGQRLHDRMSMEPFNVYEKEIYISISVGVSGAVKPSITLDDMLRNADESLYAAKEAGRDNVACGKFE